MQETMKDNDMFLKQLEHWNRQGEYEKTIQKIIHLSEAERDADVLCLLAEALHAKKMDKEALRALKQIAPKARKQAKWYSVYSRVLYSLQRYAEALTAVDLLLQLTPGGYSGQRTAAAMPGTYAVAANGFALSAACR